MGAVPTSLAAECSIDERAVEAPLAGPTGGAHARDVEGFDHDHIMLLGQCGGGLVQHVAARRGGMSMHPADTGLDCAPPLRRCPRGLGNRTV